MSPWLEIAVAIAMAIGLVGVIVPVLPGLILMWGAVGVWALLDGGGAWRWATFGVVTVLAVVGTVAALTLSGRKATDAGAPWWALVFALVGAVIGFVMIPVLGIVVGGIAGLWVAELIRLRDPRTAWDTTWSALQGYGLGTVIQMVAGVAIVLIWAVGVAVS